MRLLLASLALFVASCAHATSSGLLAPGRAAPDVALRDQAGVERRLSEFRGRPLVVYFYPKDGTPGCTREACAFRDAWQRYTDANVALVGVSTQDVASHAEFAREHELPFPLLADTEGRMADAFGVARHLGLSSRVTFVLDGEGVVREVIEDVDVGVHADQVLAAVARMQGERP
ncbi:MAG: peroxiredoxin [Polyangiales bacterium]